MGEDIIKVLELLDHKGVGELAKVVTSLFDEDGQVKDDISWSEIARLAIAVIAPMDDDLAPFAGLADALAQNPGLLTQGNLRGTVKELAKKAIGADKQTSALIDIADLLLQVLEAE
ncbi:MAG: hypothetical protein ACI9OJ_004029 [Myxococcota bacterium]